MNALTQHILLPAMAPLAVVGLYLTPLSVLGCTTRGLLGAAVVFLSLIAAIVVGIYGLRARASSTPGSGWHIASMCVLALPALLVLGPLG